MTYVFDIDGTICTKVTDGNYEGAKPIKKRIAQINKLYESGNTIIFQTARGMGRSHNSPSYAHTAFYSLTQDQLEKWKVKYHQLFLGKPAGDLYIDDKAVRDTDFFNVWE